jgi:hypothetical protein
MFETSAEEEDVATREAPSLGDPITAVRQYIDAFNRDDADRMAARFAVRGSILDGMAPHRWHGESAVVGKRPFGGSRRGSSKEYRLTIALDMEGAMEEYRLYYLDPNGHIRGAEVLSCADDAEAIKAFEAHVSDRRMELWQLARRIKTYSPPAADA